MGVDMVDGFHWTRVTSKQLRFLYEEVTTLPTPPADERACRGHRPLASRLVRTREPTASAR